MPQPIGLTTEVLAPVGNWDMAFAAVQAGANAIYMGVPGFNARGRTQHHSIDELKIIINYCHLHGVKVYGALNILVFEQELESLEILLREIIPLGFDAFIVQDIGAIQLMKRICPDVEVHASTQMTITSAEAIEMVAPLGISRYVLGREVSIDEIRKIREKSAAPLEVFVHGALCVAYSGQCLTSESEGGRSANRGQCAQACRLPYKLVVDGKVRELGDKRYLVSPKDLCGLSDVPALVQLGVESLKIEGRLKSPEYVYKTVKEYKNAVLGIDSSNLDKLELSTCYSRGLFSGWLGGVNHQLLVDGRYSSHQGPLIGTVKEIGRGILVRNSLGYKISAGDGIVCCDFINDKKFGARLKGVNILEDGLVELVPVDKNILFKIHKGFEVYLNDAQGIISKIHQQFSGKDNLRRINFNLLISAEIGKPLEVKVSDDRHEFVIYTEEAVQGALSAPISCNQLRNKLDGFGDIPFKLDKLIVISAQDWFISNSSIKKVKKEIAEQLIELRTKLQSKSYNFISISDLKPKKNDQCKTAKESGKISVLIRDFRQLEGLIRVKKHIGNEIFDRIYLDFEHGKEYGEVLARGRDSGFKVGICTTRIYKPSEQGHLRQILRLRPDAVLVRNLGALKILGNSGLELIGDFSLNITNSITANWFLQYCQYICPSYDLNVEQLKNLLSSLPSNRIETTVYQYMPSFHMEHCVFAAFMSNGTSYRDCGRPCEKHSVSLLDINGLEHPLKADAECRNTMFYGVPQSAGRFIKNLLEVGVKSFRLEALFETPDQLYSKCSALIRLIQGDLYSDVFDQLDGMERYGVTDGQLLNIGKYQDRKKESVSIPENFSFLKGDL